MLTETSDCCTVTGTYQQQHECTQLYPKRSVMTLIKTLASILLPLISTATAAGQHELVTSANALFEVEKMIQCCHFDVPVSQEYEHHAIMSR